MGRSRGRGDQGDPRVRRSSSRVLSMPLAASFQSSCRRVEDIYLAPPSRQGEIDIGRNLPSLIDLIHRPSGNRQANVGCMPLSILMHEAQVPQTSSSAVPGSSGTWLRSRAKVRFPIPSAPSTASRGSDLPDRAQKPGGGAWCPTRSENLLGIIFPGTLPLVAVLPPEPARKARWFRSCETGGALLRPARDSPRLRP